MIDLYTHATRNDRKAAMMSEKMMETEIVRLHREGKRAESLHRFAEKYQVRLLTLARPCWGTMRTPWTLCRRS